ncbi:MULTISPECIES: Do family serine endopeptidase [Psychrobacter]|uniref:Do family serine endopeptidase n=2 Tax=Moraxellaceae TaxID=468 RepID=UPI0006D8AC8F|nr:MULTISPECIES: Do family serine endopeptidase [Psychrobacter]MBE8608139.1 Do family serine endopeptidase [Pseudomonas lundensis]HCI75969.1 Do family serine endopeptidase [Psychrobacter sp.]
MPINMLTAQSKFYVPHWLKRSALVLAVSTSMVTGVTATAMASAQAVVTTADFSDLVQQVTPAVARVNVTKTVSEAELAQAQTAELLRQFFGDRLRIPDQAATPAIEHAYGTAFFVTADGYMLTNHHVVEGADKITVTLNDRTELDATLVGSDERSDVAVLKVSGNQFPALPIGDSNALKVGEPVLAIGSPFGFDYSASAGIVSAKSRSFSRDTSVPFIQTDVALNPGNSGGPLFNQRGEVIGINSRIFSGTGGYMGLSFSIPIDAAMDIYEQLKTDGEVVRAYLGIYPQDIDRNLAEAYNLDRPQGALLTRVSPDSPAQKAGLKPGDIILQYNEVQIMRASDLLNLLNRAKPSDSFRAQIQRNGKQMTISGKLTYAPNDVRAQGGDQQNDEVQLGLRLRNLTADEQAEIAVDNKTGILVTTVDPTGLAARSGLLAGDVITNFHQKPIKKVTDFSSAISSLPKKGVVTIEIIRQGIPAIIGLRIE